LIKMQSKKAVMIIAQNQFRDEEFLFPKEVLERGGVKVSVASRTLGKASGKLGAQVTPDLMLKDIKADNFDAIIFVGGIGSLDYWDDSLAHGLIKDAFSTGRIVAGICSAVVTLARSGILKDRKATVFPGDQEEIVKMGAYYTGAPVEKDANIITASGPQAAVDFGKEILKSLK